jgi:hypothetical protein
MHTIWKATRAHIALLVRLIHVCNAWVQATKKREIQVSGSVVVRQRTEKIGQ